jgi:small GTP-binding protein
MDGTTTTSTSITDAPSSPTTPDIPFDICIKLCIVGDSSSGKTSLMNRFIHNTHQSHPNPTIGVDVHSKIITTLEGTCKVKVMICDTSSQYRFRTHAAQQMKQADVVFLTLDLSKPDSVMRSKDRWLEHMVIENQVRNVTVIGTKCDIKASNSNALFEELEQYCTTTYPTTCFSFIENSSKTNLNIEETFQSIVLKAVEQREVEHSEQALTSNTIDMSDLDSDDGPQKTISVLSSELQYKQGGLFSRWTRRTCSILQVSGTKVHFLEIAGLNGKPSLTYDVRSTKLNVINTGTHITIKVFTENPRSTFYLTDEKLLPMNKWRTILKQCGATEEAHQNNSFFSALASASESTVDDFM